MSGCSKSNEDVIKDFDNITLQSYIMPTQKIEDYISAQNSLQTPEDPIDITDHLSFKMDHNYPYGNEVVLVRHCQVSTTDPKWLKVISQVEYIWITDLDLLDVNNEYDLDLTTNIHQLYTELNITSEKPMPKALEILYKLIDQYSNRYSKEGSTHPEAFFNEESLNARGFTELTRLLLMMGNIQSTFENISLHNELHPVLEINNYIISVEKALENTEKISAYLFLTKDEAIHLGYKFGPSYTSTSVLIQDHNYYSGLTEVNNTPLSRKEIKKIISNFE